MGKRPRAPGADGKCRLVVAVLRVASTTTTTTTRAILPVREVAISAPDATFMLRSRPRDATAARLFTHVVSGWLCLALPIRKALPRARREHPFDGTCGFGCLVAQTCFDRYGRSTGLNIDIRTGCRGTAERTGANGREWLCRASKLRMPGGNCRLSAACFHL